ncbi:hypothetical protein BDQ17DRAFT_138050 [Cyathus striatus]|nr:hypothetical protein BDQ17DRAFT_138050 [Cyathus striatus]
MFVLADGLPIFPDMNNANALELAPWQHTTSPSPFAMSLDVNNAKGSVVAACNLAISLVLYTYHARVIKAAINGKAHVVTTNHISPTIQELDEEVKKARIVAMNEIGLNFGTDYIS